MRCVLTLFFILFNCNVNPGILIGILQKRFQKWPDQFRELPKICPWQLRKKPQDYFDVGSQRTYHVVHPVSLFSTIVVPWPGHFLIGASFFSVPDCTPKNLHMALGLCQGSWSTLVSPLYHHHLLGLYWDVDTWWRLGEIKKWHVGVHGPSSQWVLGHFQT